MQFWAFLNRCRTKPLILLMLGLCSCGFGNHNLPLRNLSSSDSVLYSIDIVNGRVLRYVPNQMGTATLDSSINLPAKLTPTLVTTDIEGNVYIGGYTSNASQSEVLVYEATASDDDEPLRTLQLEAGKLVALVVDRNAFLYAALQNSVPTIHVYSGLGGSSAPGGSGEEKAVRVINPSLEKLNDLSLDIAGSVYVSGVNGGTSVIREFAATGTVKTEAVRTIEASNGSAFYGLTVDDDGTIFVMEDHTICEFASSATGMARPVQTINLPARFAAYTSEVAAKMVRRDGLGDIFVPVTMTGASGSANMIYGFAASASGDATPMLQFSLREAAGAHGQDMPLAVF